MSDEAPKKRGFFKRLKEGLAKTRSGFLSRLDGLLASGKVDEELLEELEMLLITADFGVETSRKVLDRAMSRLKRGDKKDAPALKEALKAEVSERLAAHQGEPPHVLEKPRVVLVVGVNGVGKTTTIGKLATRFSAEGQKVMLAAGDTFRAAAVEQLHIWGKRADCPVISQKQGADSASVVYDALASARAQRMDILIADTAGRLHTQANLMEELIKVKRVLGKIDPEAPHEVMMVLDATTGQNALHQVKQFHQALGLTGLAITKLDGTAKGGVVVALADAFDIPVRYIGVGEGQEDLRPFEPDAFAEALFQQ